MFSFCNGIGLCMVSRDGFNVVTPTSADCIGWAIFPWLSLATLKLLDGVGKETRVKEKLFLSLLWVLRPERCTS